MLNVENITVAYGLITAVRDVTFYIKHGETVALIGANGAGKTTILNAVSGILPLKSGRIFYNGQDISRTPAYKKIPLGMAHIPEGRRVFQQLSVEENLRLGAYTRHNRAESAAMLQLVYGYLPRLDERRSQPAGTLSGGEQQMLAIGRALMSKPDIILMDEPSMGLSPLLVGDIFRIITDINKNGTTVFLVEQNAKKALSVADRAYVVESGRIVLEGKASALLEDERVKSAYLGE